MPAKDIRNVTVPRATCPATAATPAQWSSSLPRTCGAHGKALNGGPKDQQQIAELLGVLCSVR